jgi:hypothetical protein
LTPARELCNKPVADADKILQLCDAILQTAKFPSAFVPCLFQNLHKFCQRGVCAMQVAVANSRQG